MKRYILCLSLVLAAVAGVVLSAQAGVAGAQGLAVKVVGLQVTAPVADQDMMMQPFHSPPGVALALMVHSPARTIVSFDQDASRLDALQDEKGKDLKAESPDSFQPSFGLPQISKDGKTLLFQLWGNGVPSAGSIRIRARGTAVLQIGTGQETARQVNVPLKKGTKITAGPVQFTIKNVMQGSISPEGMDLWLSADQDTAAISDIQFQDAAGNVIETPDTGTFRTRSMGHVSVTKQISFQKKVASATVVTKYWKALQTVRVPLKIDVGMSLK